MNNPARIGLPGGWYFDFVSSHPHSDDTWVLTAPDGSLVMEIAAEHAQAFVAAMAPQTPMRREEVENALRSMWKPNCIFPQKGIVQAYIAALEANQKESPHV